ncbi:MAG: hypothetical protein K5989_12610 [Lachnospiraceae bacterium]|nr:hypothetical protein [Lachnospiraceae bacterium]
MAVFCTGCPGTDGGNAPYEPDTPAPEAHDGTFTSEHGTMTFNGDGESIEVDFDEELAGLIGIPSGKQKGTYAFLSGDLPPNGSIPIRYDVAHEMEIIIGNSSAVLDMGIASEDGSTGQTGVDVVTPERIPMLFKAEKGFFHIMFTKQ